MRKGRRNYMATSSISIPSWIYLLDYTFFLHWSCLAHTESGEMVLHLLLQFSWLSVATVASLVLPGCPEKCGDITVPYPFGIRQGCYKNIAFQMVCNDTFEPPRLFTSTDSNLEVLNISLEGEVRIRGWMSWDCYSRPGVQFDQFNGLMDLKNSSPYTFSSRNTFVVVGCDTSAYLTESSGSGCVSSCNKYSVTNASCTGHGCCQTNVPKDLKRFDVRFTSIDNHTSSWAITPCSFAFFVASDAQEPTVSDILDGTLEYNRYALPIVLDWRIGKETCYEAERNLTSYGCAANSSCSQPLANSSGYICLCPPGLSGNPYIQNGCSGKYAFCCSLVFQVTWLSHPIQN